MRGYESLNSLKRVRDPTWQAGVFAFAEPIPSDGIMRSISGLGSLIPDTSATNDERTIQYSMTLHIAQPNSDSEIISNYIIPITANTCNENGIGRFEKHLELKVMAGDIIALEVARECSDDGNLTICPFLPVATTTDNTSPITYSQDLNFSTPEVLYGFALALTASIQTGRLHNGIIYCPYYISLLLSTGTEGCLPSPTSTNTSTLALTASIQTGRLQNCIHCPHLLDIVYRE